MKITPDNFFLFIFIFWDVTEIIFGTTAESILGLPTNQANSMVSYIILLLLMVHIRSVYKELHTDRETGC